jgi:hypothetical protein
LSASRTVASRIQYLGIQEASRKRRPPTRTPGAWAGGVFRTSAMSDSVTVSQDKWEKAKLLIGSLWDVLVKNNTACEGDNLEHVILDYKELEINTRFSSPSIHDV